MQRRISKLDILIKLIGRKKLNLSFFNTTTIYTILDVHLTKLKKTNKPQGKMFLL